MSSHLPSSQSRTAIAVVVCVLLAVSGERGLLLAQSASPSMPFGPKQTPYTAFALQPFTGAYINASSAKDLQLKLPEARKYGLRLLVKLAPAHDSMISPTTGCFDINLWKGAIDQLRSFDFAPYVADGTVIGAELVNEPHVNDWCVSTPMRLSKEIVEEMGAYAKSIWPTMPMGCGRSDWLVANAPWRYLDFGHSQYHMRKGDVDTWRAATVEESRKAGVGLLLSLNYLSGQLDDSPMTAEQLRQHGTALARDTYACMLTGYLYDETYFSQPGVMDAFKAIAAVAGSHAAPPCYFGPTVKPGPNLPRAPSNLRVLR